MVFGNTTGGPFNVNVLNTEVTHPAVTDDKTSTYTLENHIDGLYQEIGSVLSSPPIISPDLSAYYLSGYTYFAGTVTAGMRVITITDAGLYGTPTMLAGPALDGGFAAVVLEVAGASTFDAGHTTVTGDTATLGAGLFTLAAINELTVEAGMLMDSSSLVPLATGTGNTVLYTFSDRFPAGSSFWTVQVTQQGGTKRALSGFSNPIYYTGGVLTLGLLLARPPCGRSDGAA